MRRQLILVWVMAFLLCSVTVAQHLETNPNPSDNTITVTTYAENSVCLANLSNIGNWLLRSAMRPGDGLLNMVKQQLININVLLER